MGKQINLNNHSPFKFITYASYTRKMKKNCNFICHEKKKKEINSHFVRRKNIFDLRGEQQIHLSHHENIGDQ